MGLFGRRKKEIIVTKKESDSVVRGKSAEERTVSLYECIKANCVEGVLPEDFSLPDDEELGKVRFADGAMDGMVMFHAWGNSSLDEDGHAKMEYLVKLISDADSKNGEQENVADEELLSFMKRHRALSVIDEVQGYIRENSDKFIARNIYHYGLRQILTSADRECVKFGLLLLELFTLKEERVKEIVRTLALSDEFTLFALFVMVQWENRNEEIFNVVKKVNGWGKIHAVERLEPATEEIKDWLLHEGIKNQVLPAYSALVCYEKAEVEKRLFETPVGELPIQDYRSIGMILYEMLDEGPVAGISAVKNRYKVLKVYLEHGLAWQKNERLKLEEYEPNLAIEKYLQDEVIRERNLIAEKK